MKATAIANSNIAFIKYWGKKDTRLNLPMNPSISMTLDEKFQTKTTVEFSKKYDKDTFVLNNKEFYDKKLHRVSAFLDIIRKRANSKLKANVISENSFPTGSGIASSASGFAALSLAATKALQLNLSKKELSSLARQGSGSASRSIHGGFVFWEDECAEQLFGINYWPELRDIVVILENEEKKTSSRQGMKMTVETSELYKKRLKLFPERINEMKTALKNKDFRKMAELIMRESDSMHACMRDTMPSIVYLNSLSEKIKDRINLINKESVIAAYSFDAGPNAHIITLEKHIPLIKKELKSISKNIIVSKTGGEARII